MDVEDTIEEQEAQETSDHKQELDDLNAESEWLDNS